MAKLTLSDLSNLNNQTSAVNTINSNSSLIETAMEQTLSRDGTSPNEMNANLDMNSNHILNLPEPFYAHSPATKEYVDDLALGGNVPIGIQSIVAGGGVSVDDSDPADPVVAAYWGNITASQVASTTISSTVSMLRTSGHSAAGDGGAATYKRVGSEPSHAGKLQSEDGAWWEITERTLRPEMFGAFGDGSASTATAIANAYGVYSSGFTIDLSFKPGDWRWPSGLTPKSTWKLKGWGPCLKRDDNTGFIQGTGTRLLGYVYIENNDNGEVEGISADAGSLYLGSNPATDAFYFGKSNPTTLGLTQVQSPRIRNVNAITKGSGSGAHAVLIQHVTNAHIENVVGFLAQFAFVFKGTYSSLYKIRGEGSTVASVIFKSDDYAPCEHNKVYDVVANAPTTATTALSIYATTEQMNGNKFFGVRTIGGGIGVSVFGGTRAQASTNRLYGLVIDGFSFEGADDYGIQYIGCSNLCTLANGTITGTVSNRALSLDSETLGVSICNVICSVPANQADNVTLQGLFSVDNLQVIVNNNPASLGTILFNPEFLSLCHVGSYLANSNYDSDDASLINGWDWFQVSGYEPKQRFQNDTVILSGVLETPGSRTGSNQAAMTLIAPPVENQQFAVLAQNPVDGKAVPVIATALTTGQLTFTLFTSDANTNGAWPNANTAIPIGSIRYRTK